ncbi:MAG: ABC transporter substrate-binding protein [Chloroflexi bacterium]|nr:ABC transporter substrate-binding protein [Chloroflexota bacterium]
MLFVRPTLMFAFLVAMAVVVTTLLPVEARSQGEINDPAGAGQPPLRIGVLVPSTGALSIFGPDYINAANLAAQEINAAGGVNGGQVVIVTGDTGTSPEQGVSEAERLVSIEGVVAIMGAASSSVSLAVAESVTIPNGILQISPASTSAALTDVADSDLLFRTAVSDNAQAIVLAQVVAEDLGLTSVCDMHVNNAYGQGLASTFADRFAELGGTVKASVPHDDASAVSYAAELAECTAGGPEALIAMSYPTGQATVYLRQALELGLIDNFVFVDGTKSSAMFEGLGWRNFDGMLGTAPAALETAFGDAFDDAYVAEYGALYRTPFVREAYDAVVAIALGAAAAGTNTDSAAIRDNLRGPVNAPGAVYGPGEDGIAAALAAIAAEQDIDYQGASGPLDFDENGDNPFGAVEVWQVDACSRSLFTIRRVRVDLEAGESMTSDEFMRLGVVGDVDGDDVSNSIDAALILQFNAGLLPTLPCTDGADVNGDGNINSIDAALILQFTAGLLATLPPSTKIVSGREPE